MSMIVMSTTNKFTERLRRFASERLHGRLVDGVVVLVQIFVLAAARKHAPCT